ncbi:MAG: hypothetical protein IGBAC_2042 [Ignavibacteriae bacterium]|nr:MAG: hypothetical protein IGBAC_2042 [Ignavibacteriota bacterium]
MEIKINTLIDQIETHSNKKLNFRHLIILLIETSKNYNLESDFENLVFIGKFLFNVKRILTRNALAEENYTNLLVEFQNNFSTFISTLKKFSDHFSSNDKIEFENLFLNNSKHEKLNLLIDDFNEIKNYEIDKRIKLI